MQPQLRQNPSNHPSRQLSPNNSVVSRKSTQKELLKQEISFLKEQVKKLKIDKLNQKILHDESKNSFRTKQNNNTINPLQQNNFQPSEGTQYLLDKKSQKQQNIQPIVNFRVGRIVKNNQQLSQQRSNFRQCQTIEVRKKNSSEVFMFSKPSHSRISNDQKNSQIQSEQIFRTIQSNHKFSFFQENTTGAQELKPVKNNFLSKQFVKQKKKKSIINFNETIQSAELPFPTTNDNQREDLQLNSDIKVRNIFSKSTTFKQPQNFTRISKARTDRIGFTLSNPEYQQEQVGDIIRDKNINIRKISYKLKKTNNNSKDPQILRKQQLMEEFLKHQIQSQQRNLRYSVVNKHQYQESRTQDNAGYQATKASIIGKNSFKSRLMSKSKVHAQSIDEELKHKLRGKIIKNFGQPDAQVQQVQPQSQDQFSGHQIPEKKFSLSQIPYFGQRPHPKSNQDQIIDLTLSIARKLSITSIKRQALQGIVIKKFKNCLIFCIPETNKKIIWYYEGRFFFGQGEKQGQEGYKSGEGLQFISEKNLYKGQFSENKKHGSGIMITQRGNIYEGQWYQGKQHGNGKVYDPEADHIYQGEFKNGKFDGFGILKVSQTQIYKGIFAKNIKHGFGTEIFKNGDKYKGSYEQGKFHGKGRYKWSNGNIYQGQFVMGLRTGPGKWRSLSHGGDMYIGMYLNDKKHGLGKYCWQDGSVFQGNFQNDQKHGEGILTYKDGKTVHGRWELNQLVEVMNVESDSEEQIKTFKEQGFDRVRLIQRVPNEILRPHMLRSEYMS